MSDLEHHLQYLQNMVQILNSIQQHNLSSPSATVSPMSQISDTSETKEEDVAPPSPEFVRSVERNVYDRMFSTIRRTAEREINVMRDVLLRELGGFLTEYMVFSHVPEEDDSDTEDMWTDHNIAIELRLVDDMHDESEVDDEELRARAGSEMSVPEDLSDDQNSCAICFEPFSDQLFKTVCSHRFHTACIGEWLRKKSNCPVCRHRFSEQA